MIFGLTIDLGVGSRSSIGRRHPSFTLGLRAPTQEEL
jgi:hypothetical protein